MQICLSLVLTAWLFTGAGLILDAAWAQGTVRTETIRPPKGDPQKFRNDGRALAPAAEADIITDTARLPPAVARMRTQILDAARSGDPGKLAALMRAGDTMPVFTFSDDTDPVAYWKKTYPDSEGVEALAILVNVLEAGFVHVDAGTPQEIYLWPYFARRQLKSLTAQQRLELFRIVTGADYKDMIEFGAYSFYRLGIAPDGSWQFFVQGD